MKKWSDEETKYLKDFYKYKTAKEIAKSLGRSLGSINKKVRYLGLSKFIDIRINENKEFYYFLGLLSADGNLSSKRYNVTITLHQKDKLLLESLKQKLGFGSIYYYNYEGRSPTVTFSIVNKNLHREISDLGIRPRKTFNMKFPNIPNRFLSHYIRGFFDGDGTIYFHKASKSYHSTILSASEAFLNELINVIRSESEVSGGCVYNYNNCYHFRMSKKDTIKFGKWIYNDAELYLERKYNRFLDT